MPFCFPSFKNWVLNEQLAISIDLSSDFRRGTVFDAEAILSAQHLAEVTVEKDSFLSFSFTEFEGN